jgi:hypothetical protein
MPKCNVHVFAVGDCMHWYRVDEVMLDMQRERKREKC